MLSMMRAQLYRVAKSRSVWALCLIIGLFVLATPFALWLYQVWPAFAATGIVEVPDEPLPLLQLWGVSIASGSVFAVMIGIVLVEIFVEDFKSGYVKNLVQARGGRVSYVASIAVCGLIVAAAMVIGATVLVTLAFAVQGYPFVMPTAMEGLGWMGQMTLCSVAYASVAVLAVFVTRSEAAGVVVALVVSSGMAERVLQLILANIPGAPVAPSAIASARILRSILGSSAQGMVCDPMTYVQAIATFAVVVALWLVIMRRKSLA